MARRIALVTDELFPLTRGGIGRLLHNLVRDSVRRSSEVEFHVLLCGVPSSRAAEIEERFGPQVRGHAVEFSSAAGTRIAGERVFPPASAFTDARWHAESLDILLALQALEASGLALDWIEFPDYRGWAMCTLHDKLLGHAFQRTGIAVRLHSTDGVLQHFEPRRPVPEQSGRFELERKSLRDADLVVGSIAAVAAFNTRYYGFDQRWRDRVRIEFPPVLAPADSSPAVADEAGAMPDLVFATKVQPFKRPDLFVQGAALFMAENPDYRGRAILACHADDETLLAQTLSLVPTELAPRFAVVGAGAEREALLGRSIVVIPSDYESLNLTAYEAAAAGARLVLNGSCPAFGDDSPFVAPRNCWKFDGTVESLAATLRKAWTGPKLACVSPRTDTAYWMEPPPEHAPEPSGAPPRVSVVIAVRGEAGELAAALAHLQSSGDSGVEVIVVHGPSAPPDEIDAATRTWTGPTPVRVVRSGVERGEAGARNLGIRAASGEYVVTLDATDRLAPGFLSRAAGALQLHAEFDVVAPTCASFDDDEALAANRWVEFAVFLGDAPTIGLAANRLGPAVALFRSSLLHGSGYDERLVQDSEWELLLRLALAGRRFLVTNDVQAFRRTSRAHPVESPTPEHVALQHRIMETLTTPLPASVRLTALVAETGAALELAARAAAEHERARSEQVATAQLLEVARADAARESRDAAAARGEAAAARSLAESASAETALARAEMQAFVERQAAADKAAAERAADELRQQQANKPVRYSMVDFANERLKKVPLAHPILRGAATALRRVVRRGRPGHPTKGT